MMLDIMAANEDSHDYFFGYFGIACALVFASKYFIITIFIVVIIIT